MRRSLALLLLMFAELLVTSGCCMPRRSYTTVHFDSIPHPSASLKQLATTEREPFLPDVHAPLLDLEATNDYHELDAERCRCRAVEASQLGNLLDDQRRHLDWMLRAECPEDRTILDVLKYAALEARNRSAAAALTLLYTMAELEGRRDLTEHALAIIDEALADVAEVRQRGLPFTGDDAQLERDRSELRAQQAEIEIGLLKANRELKSLLDYDNVSIDTRIWPDVDLVLNASTIEPDAAVRDGLRHRNDLRAIQRLNRCKSPRQLGASRAALEPIHSLLATTAGKGGCCLSTLLLALNRDPHEAEHRQQQWQSLGDRRQREIDREIRTNIAVLVQREQHSAIEQNITTSWDDRIVELVAAHTIGKSTPAEITQARLKRIAARDKVLQSVVATKVAQVTLLESQGLLVCCDRPLEPPANHRRDDDDAPHEN